LRDKNRHFIGENPSQKIHAGRGRCQPGDDADRLLVVDELPDPVAGDDHELVRGGLYLEVVDDRVGADTDRAWPRPLRLNIS
jgi:hypothetical protein